MLEPLVNPQPLTHNQENAILPGAPWLIAHRSMLGINQPYKFTLNNKDYVLWQNQNGEISALNNICPHMQAPLSDGWICSSKNTIACPFHGLEFNGEGKIYHEGEFAYHPLAESLEIFVEQDLIWTYGGLPAKLPIPNLIPRLSQDCYFLGATALREIAGEFLKCLKINYDFNHATVTHREPFQLDTITVRNYEANSYHTKLVQEVSRADNSWQDVLKNPALLTAPKTLVNRFEYSFPSTTSIVTETSFGNLIQLFILYPQTQQKTNTFVLLYYKPKNTLNKWLMTLLKKSFLDSFALIVEQDVNAIETLYPPQNPKIRLPREEIMFHAEKLYQEWQ